MAQTKWFVFFFMTFAICNLISGVLEMSYIGAQSPAWNNLLATWGETSTSSWGVLTLPKLMWEGVVTIWNMFSWNYAFFDGPWMMVKIAILYPLSAALALSLVVTGASIVRGGGG